MIGAVIGDIIGSPYEFHNIKTKNFPLFSDKSKITDDSVLTCAVADSILNHKDPKTTLQEWGQRYLSNGFGKGFTAWLNSSNPKPYQAQTNGCVMRISAVAFLIPDVQKALNKAAEITNLTHNHSDSLLATKAYVLMLHDFLKGEKLLDVVQKIEALTGYDLSKTPDEIRPNYNKFYCKCVNSVPQAMSCALWANSFEGAVRGAVSLGGDSDTLACMAGALAEARFGIPPEILEKAKAFMPADILTILKKEYQISTCISHHQSVVQEVLLCQNQLHNRG